MVDGNFIGGVFAVLSSVVNCLGANIQKYSHVREAKRIDEGEAATAMIMRPMWWLGMITMCVGSGLDFVGMGYANQALVAALGGSTMLICNVLLAYFWMGEELYRTDAIGVILIIIAAVIFAIAAPPAPEIDVDDVQDNFTRVEFEIYVFIQSFIICVMLGTIANTKMYEWRASLTRKMIRPVIREFRHQNRVLKKRVERLEEEVHKLRSDVDELHPREESSVATGTAVASNTLFEDEDELERSYDHWTDCYIYASTGGMVGAFAILFAGCVSKILLHDAIDGFQSPMFYAILSGMVVTLVWQVKLLNSGLETGDVMVVLPVYMAFWITFGVISGVVFYHHGETSLLGLFFVFFGVIFFLRHGRIKAGKPPLMNVPGQQWLHQSMTSARNYGGIDRTPEPTSTQSETYQQLHEDTSKIMVTNPEDALRENAIIESPNKI